MRRPGIVLTILLLLSGASSYAQTNWTLIKSNQHDFGASFQTRFLNEQYGFALPYAGGIFPGFRTTDGGNTWIQAVGNFGNPVNDLQWLTPSKLYCITDGSQFLLYLSEDSGKTWNIVSNFNGRSDQLYVKGDSVYLGGGRFSYDGGKTFNVLPQKDFRDGVLAVAGNKDNSIAFCGDPLGGDHGTLFTTNYGESWNVGAEGDDSHFLYSKPYTHTYFRATAVPLVTRHDQHSNGRPDSSTVERTTNAGKTWQTVLSTQNPNFEPLYLSGGITGSGCVVYVQGTFKHPPGDLTTFPTFQSTDLGNTWKNIGGPANYNSIYISAVARGAILYEGDGHGGLWKFTDSSLLRPATADMEIEMLGTGISSDTIYTSACDTALVQLNYGFRACDYVLMDSLSVEGISEYTISYRKGHVLMDGRPDTAQVSFFPPTSGTYHIKIHTRVQRDDWVLEDTALQLVLVVKPNPGSLSTAPTDTLDLGSQVMCQLHLDSNFFYLSAHGCEAVKVTGMYFEPDASSVGEFSFVPVSSFTLGAADPSKLFTIQFLPKTIGIKHGRVIIETTTGNDTIYIKGTVLPGAILLSPSQKDIQFGVVSNCTHPIDSIITLTNRGCDTLRITQGPGNLPPEFQLLPPFQLPIILPPDSSVVVHFRFAPTKRGNYTASPHFHAEQQGLTQDISVTLEGNGIEEGGLLSYSPKQFSFPSLSICAHDSASGSITNIGCDTMSVDGKYFGAIDYSTIGLNATGWGVLAPNETYTYSVYLNPSQKGIRQGYIILTSTNNIGVKKDSIPFTVTVLDGTKILSASQNTLDFGTTSLCAEKDTTFLLRNTGCDTIWIKGYGVSGVGFGVKDSSFFIPPGGSKSIDVHTVIDTTGHITSNSDQLTIQSDADNPISPITLTRSFTYPKDYSVRFSVSDPSGKNQDQVTMQIIADSLPQGLTELSANLTIGNTDLLSFVDYTSPNQVTLNGSTLTITGNPIKTSGNVLAELHYKVFLTKDSTTSINFSNVSFNNSDPDYASCVATVQGAANAGFNYEFRCAEHTIAKLFRNEQIRISSINPNPTQGEITIMIESPIKTEGILEIYDILGKQVLSERKQFNKGSNSILLDTKSLARGRYSVRLKTENSEVQGAFVKE